MKLVCIPESLAQHVERSPFPGVRTVIWDGVGTPPDLAAEVDLWVPAYGKNPFSAFAELPALRVVQVLSAGVEPWLEVVPADVMLCNGRGIHGAGTTEVALIGILAQLRRLPVYLDQQKRGEWARCEMQSLDGRRVLVIGVGDIGQRVGAVLELLGAEVGYVARTPREGVHGVTDLPRLLPESEVVVTALPHTAETNHLVDAAFLAAMPDNALLVNIGRGGVVDTDALLAEAGRLRASLDVTEPEPLPADHPLWHAPGVLIFPHTGGGTPGWQDRAFRLLQAQIARYVAGEPLANIVAHGY